MERETIETSMPVTSSAADGLEQLLSLEEKIHQTIALLKSARMEKEGLLRENERLRREREEQENLFRTMESRLAGLEKERETVRARVQKLLELVDSLTKQSSES